MIILVSLASLGAIGLSLLFHAVLFAPLGEEDDAGFHLTVREEPPRPHTAGATLAPADLVFFN